MTTPVEKLIAAFGGTRAAARAIGVSATRVCRWSKPANKDGCDGRIPDRHKQAVLAAAARDGVDFTAADLEP